MTNSIRLIIPGKPMGKGRPRFYKGYVTPHVPTVNYENLVKTLCIQEKDRRPEFKGEVKANIRAYYQIPKSTSKKKAVMMANDFIRPKTKPDLDNVAKVILDALNGIAYHDDSQVSRLLIEKRYAEEPRVEVMIEYVEER